jgi:hypothetical protein
MAPPDIDESDGLDEPAPATAVTWFVLSGTVADPESDGPGPKGLALGAIC